MENIVIIGAGASGMMAALTAAEGGDRRVLLLERQQRPGRKLLATGNGRCNLTNTGAAPANYHGQKADFAAPALRAFPPEAALAFFRTLGLVTVTEPGGRVYPLSDSANSVLDVLRFALDRRGVELLVSCPVRELRRRGRGFAVRSEQGELSADKLILACGGASYPGTGSNGDGYKLARALGHTVGEIVPSLVPLVSNDEDCPKLMGLSLRNCRLWVTEAGKKKPVFEEFGELLFTHFGLSGPTVLSASAHLRPMAPGKFTAHIDLKPALDPQKLDARVLRDFSKNQNRIFANSLDELLPQKLIPVVIARSGIAPETRCHSITREERQRLCGVLKDFMVEIEGFRPIAEAIVTSGGVRTKEIDPRTMQSRLIGGLYFAGEMIDCDAYTGGYNLQIAFSTGRLSAESLP